MRRLLILLAFSTALHAQILQPIISGNVPPTYYLDASAGSDSNAGTLAAPWQTLNKINTRNLSPGTSVKLKRGETWRETLTLPSSGTVAKPITFDRYGASGADPIISGADLATEWTAATGTPETCTGTCLALADAEANDTSQFSGVTTAGTATFAAGTAFVPHGVYGFTVTSDASSNAYGYKTVSAQNDIYVRFYVNVKTGFSVANYGVQEMVRLKDGGGTVRVGSGIRSDGAGGYQIWAGHRFGAYSNYTSNISLGTTYLVEMRFLVDGSVGGYQFWVNGSSIGSAFNINTTGMAITLIEAGMQTGQQVSTAGSVIYLDDLKIDTAAIGAWAGVSGGPANSYQFTQATQPFLVVEDGSPLTVETTSLAALTAGYWFYDGATPLYVMTTESDDPDGHVMEVGNRSFSVNLNRKTNVTISNITLANSSGTSTPLNDVAAWGDSLTYGTGSIVSYPDALATSTGRTVYNGGVAGETSTQIKARMLADSAKYQDFVVIWVGRNNITPKATVLADVAAMVNALPVPKRFVVLSVINGNFPNVDHSGGSQYVSILDLNASLAAAYPSNYIDIRTLLVGQYNPADAEDVIDQGHDVPPSTLRSNTGGNGGAGTLGSDIGDTSTCTFTITGPGVYGSTIQVGTEKIFITGIAGGDVNTCTRGYASTTAATHSNGAAYTAWDPMHLNSAGSAYVASQVAAWIAAND